MSDVNFPRDPMFPPTTPDRDLPPIALDDQGYLAAECQCVACGYNLRGLLPDGRCPECGTAIGRSVHGDLLRFSEPSWVETLSSGMNWIVAHIAISFLFGCTFGAAGASGAISGDADSLNAFALTAALGLAVIQLIGYWRLTTPEPIRAFDTTEWDARTIARYGVVAGFALGIVTSLTGMDPTSFALFNTAMAVVSAVIGIVTMIATLVYVRQLALRIPNPNLASSTKTVMWGLIVAMAAGLLTAFLALMAAISNSSGGGAFGGVMVLGLVAGLCYLIFGIWGLILIFRYRTAFALSAQEARATWAAQPM